MFFYFLSGLSPAEKEGETALNHLEVPSALLFDKISEIVNAWFKSVLSPGEASRVDNDFFRVLASVLHQDKYSEFQECYDHLVKEGEWSEIVGDD